ncbi:uncharacterized protein LOC5570366 [Aedes aegypti]|uniref:VWFC domain-containing protein n=1 Tax=Aedes aegypti TaxID=7159 RepID=A0A1S4FIZ8_AEDAE|nr:uncharacterized protein LOC5570366 [Aedes aegypti]
MLPKAILATVLLCSAVVLCNAQNTDSCPPPLKHYSELGCKPIQDEGHKCPNRYECPTLTDRDGGKCYFNGNVYDIASSLSKADQELVSCSPACHCNNRTTPASFVCAQIDCPEFFGRDESCVYQYTSGDCCSSSKVCGEEAEKLDVCYMDGEQYKEGQKMYPKDESCYSCRCQKGFDNSTIVGNPNCQEFTCGIEIHNSDSVMEGCIPVYFGTDRCCPISWRCPGDNDTVIVEGRLDVDEPVDPKMQCTFGELKLNFGDSLSSDDKCVSCKCTVPPMPHCIQNRDC